MIEKSFSHINNISVQLPDTSLIVLPNDDFYLTSMQMAKDTISDFSLYKLDEFTRRKYGQTHFKYYIMEEVDFGNSIKSYLIFEYYDSEMACWLVNYTPGYKLIDCREVYYDNAEGFHWINSVIDKSKRTIRIEEGSIYEDPEIKIIKLHIDEKGKFVEEKES